MDLRDRFTEMREMDLQVQSTYSPLASGTFTDVNMRRNMFGRSERPFNDLLKHLN